MGSRGRFADTNRLDESNNDRDNYQFEYDSEKSSSNKKKHGVDFEEAKELWNGNKRIENTLPYQGEARTMTIGQIDGKFYSAITTTRNGKIRIISVRRSRKNEVSKYEATGN